MRIVTHSNSGEQGARRVLCRWASAFLALTMALVLPFLGQALAQGQPPNGKPVAGQGLGPFDFKGDLRSLPKADLKANARHQNLRPKSPPGLTTGAAHGGPPDPLVPYSS